MAFEMNTGWAILLLAAGLLLLYKSADFLVSGAVGLAKRLGISQIVIGLTIVAMGTSAPELAASIVAALAEKGDIAVGNVYGSNVANLTLVGGLVALILPLKVRKQTLRREIPAMLAVSLLLWPFLQSSTLSRAEGIVLLAVFTALLLFTAYSAKRSSNKAGGEDKTLSNAGSSQIRDVKKCVIFVVVGLAGLALGARMAVYGAVFVGERVGLSDAVIGLTIIAVGTSLPELATCVVAAFKGHHDISIGNLVGSNIFNTLLVTGTAATVRPFTLTGRLIGSDYWIMVFVSTGFTFLVIVGRRTVGRMAGTLLLGGYVAYVIYLFACTSGT
jgi:cation:H+ antiporter